MLGDLYLSALGRLGSAVLALEYAGSRKNKAARKCAAVPSQAKLLTKKSPAKSVKFSNAFFEL